MKGSRHKLVFQKETPRCIEFGGSYHFDLNGVELMGVLNVTPDSFSDGDRYLEVDAALKHARQMIEDGASIIDVGGESTRPGALPVSAAEEIKRVVPVIEKLSQETDALISIDSYKTEVVKEAFNAGAHLANDISGGRDKAMFELCASKGAPLVIMHMQGNPMTMQKQPKYDNVVEEVASYLLAQARSAKDFGVSSVVLDPGIGFGKSLSDNIDLLNGLEEVLGSDYPILVGASRKKMIQMIEGRDSDPQDRDWGSIAVHLQSIIKGASIIRVHNVRAHSQAIKIWEALDSNSSEKLSYKK